MENLYMENQNIFEKLDDLDLTWIEDFEKIDKDYKNYYTEDIQFIKIHSININRMNFNELKIFSSLKFILFMLIITNLLIKLNKIKFYYKLLEFYKKKNY